MVLCCTGLLLVHAVAGCRVQPWGFTAIASATAGRRTAAAPRHDRSSAGERGNTNAWYKANTCGTQVAGPLIKSDQISQTAARSSTASEANCHTRQHAAAPHLRPIPTHGGTQQHRIARRVHPQRLRHQRRLYPQLRARLAGYRTTGIVWRTTSKQCCEIWPRTAP